MKKIAIIGFANIYSMPYLHKYIEAIKKSDLYYDLIFWDRENTEEQKDNYLVFRKKIDSSKNVVFKLFSFFQYKKFVIKTLKENQYDKIIVLYSLPAVLLRKYLRKHYENNYVFAYTDYTFEKNPIYRAWVGDVVNNSFFTTVTSSGFLKYLPKANNILISNNVTVFEIAKKNKNKKSKKMKIAISYIGLLRQFKHIKKFISHFKNDDRYSLNYYGTGFGEVNLREHLEKGKIKNVHLGGKYQPAIKEKLISECDIINNCFANDRFQKYAMTNRFYDALFNYKPQIVNQGSYSQEVVEKYGLGIAVDLKDKELNTKIISWYFNIDYEKFKANCDKCIQHVKAEESGLNKKISEYLS